MGSVAGPPLLCVKEWYQTFELMMDSSNIKNQNIDGNNNSHTNEEIDKDNSNIDSN